MMMMTTTTIIIISSIIIINHVDNNVRNYRHSSSVAILYKI